MYAVGGNVEMGGVWIGVTSILGTFGVKNDVSVAVLTSLFALVAAGQALFAVPSLEILLPSTYPD